MVTLKFDNITLSQFNKFKFINKKKKPKTNTDKRISKLVRGICIKDGEEFKISIDARFLKTDVIKEESNPDLILLPFTEESYKLKNINSIFSKVPDKKGKYIRLIRSDWDCKFSDGNMEMYVPFCNNWVCSGHIIRRNNILMFDFNECIAPKGYTVMKIQEDK